MAIDASDILGAPQLAGDLVVIGNGGADFAGARGYVSAYDRVSGALRWQSRPNRLCGLCGFSNWPSGAARRDGGWCGRKKSSDAHPCGPAHNVPRLALTALCAARAALGMPGQF